MHNATKFIQKVDKNCARFNCRVYVRSIFGLLIKVFMIIV